MYGLVNKAVEDLICERFGEETWEKVRSAAGIQEEVFISNDPYPDEITYRLVGAASQILNIPATAVLETFGEYWVLETARRHYGHMLDAGGHTLPDFLRNLPNFHTRVVLIFPQLQPPIFKVVDVAPNTLKLSYRSHRAGLQPFVVGLIKGLAKMFKTEVIVTVTALRDAGSETDDFLVECLPSKPA